MAIINWQAFGTERRSVELAEMRNADPKSRADGVRFFCGDASGREYFRASSRTDSTVRYVVAYATRSDRVLTCECHAGMQGRPCCHKGSVRQYIERRKARVAAAAAREIVTSTPETAA